jgi:UDP-N-acetylglucosamine 2-epimerase (non-hydrolysing)
MLRRVTTPAKVLVVLGTRPEAVKLAPVIHAARAHDDWSIRVCSTGQHRDLLPPILAAVQIEPDLHLDVMRDNQPLSKLLAALLGDLDDLLVAERPEWVVAQGDTTSVLAAAIAAHHRRIPFAHVEAGLRTHDLGAPFPEEANRRLAAVVTSLHLAPSVRAVANLRAEGVAPDTIELTGNTVVDALRAGLARLPADGGPPPTAAAQLAELHDDAPLVLVTGHRRESFDGGLQAVCEALAQLASENPDAWFVYPVHFNPTVRQTVDAWLRDRASVRLVPPVDYLTMAWLMRRARMCITDSGGIQEEAPEFRLPVMVTRVATERPEAVEAGGAVIVGYDRATIVQTATSWLRDEAAYEAARPSGNPFGDGAAGLRCVAALRRRLGLRGPDVAPWKG